MLFVNLDPNKNLSYIQIRERGLEKVKEKGNCVLECAIPLYDKASTKEKKDKLMKRRKQSSTVTLHLTRSPECLEYTGMHHRARSARLLAEASSFISLLRVALCALAALSFLFNGVGHSFWSFYTLLLMLK